MPVPARLTDMSATAASNSPAGSDSIGTSLDDILRGIQAATRGDLAHKGADIASATTADLGAVQGSFHDVTGTTTITGLGTVSAGIHKWIKFEGAVPLIHNGTSLILPGGANITTADGDAALFYSEGSGNWRCLSYQRAAKIPASDRPVLGSVTAATSGTSVDVTGIPSWAKRVTFQTVGLSTNGTSIPILQLGISTGPETSSYNGSASQGASAVSHSSGFAFVASHGAANVYHGKIVLDLYELSSNTWTAAGGIGYSNTNGIVGSIAGSKALSGTLDRVRLTTVNGTDAFDGSGSICVTWE